MFRVLVSFAAAWLLARWVYGEGPLRSLSRYGPESRGEPKRVRRVLVEGFVGAIAFGYILAQAILHFVNIFASPLAEGA